MTQKFRTGDRVTIGRFRTNHNYANDDYVGKTATITVVNEEYVRLDIDEGLDSWESKYLTLEHGQIRWMTILVKFVLFRKSYTMEYM